MKSTTHIVYPPIKMHPLFGKTGNLTKMVSNSMPQEMKVICAAIDGIFPSSKLEMRQCFDFAIRTNWLDGIYLLCGRDHFDAITPKEIVQQAARFGCLGIVHRFGAKLEDMNYDQMIWGEKFYSMYRNWALGDISRAVYHATEFENINQLKFLCKQVGILQPLADNLPKLATNLFALRQLRKYLGDNWNVLMATSDAKGIIVADRLLNSAAFHGDIRALRQLKKWGCTGFTGAFISATRGKKIRAMKLLHKWGANLSECAKGRHYHPMLHMDTLKFVRRWALKI